MHTLVTLLGRVKDPRWENYQEATYAFPGSKQYTSRFFGLTLAQEQQPDRLVVLGTAGSMWDNLMREAGLSGKAVEHLYAVSQREAVDEALLAEFVPELEERLGLECRLELIPYGRDSAEQTQILRLLMAGFEWGDSASLDVTHGFRHLPMLMQQSALLLQTLKSVEIRGIFYGALDMRDAAGVTPVLMLDGLLDVERWTKALYRYEQGGDYAAFKAPLSHEQLPAAALAALDAAAFYERTFNLSEAGRNLARLQEDLPTTSPGIGGLFMDTFREHISWAESDDLKLRQRELAYFYLKNGDFVRAAIFAMEAFITDLLHPHERRRQQDYRIRNKAETDYYTKRNGRGDLTHWGDFRDLKKIRNTLAHGTEPSRDILRIMQEPQALHTHLNNLFDRLFTPPQEAA